jgi:hypothetical protein
MTFFTPQYPVTGLYRSCRIAGTAKTTKGKTAPMYQAIAGMGIHPPISNTANARVKVSKYVGI